MDQTVLAAVARFDSSADLRKAALDRVTDTDVLFDLASNSKEAIRAQAVRKMTNSRALAKVLRSDPSPAVRIAAVEQARDPALWEEIARNDSSPDVRVAAVKKMTDAELLGEIAENDAHPAVREAASERIRLLKEGL